MNTMHDLLQFGFQNALVATVLALGVCLVTRYWRNPLLGRTLWLLVLIKLVTPPLWQMPLPLPAAPTTDSTTGAPTRTFENANAGWPGLTNESLPLRRQGARFDDRSVASWRRTPDRAIRSATDPATLATTGSKTTSTHAAPTHQAGPTSGWIDDGVSPGPVGALMTSSASTLHRPQPQGTAEHHSTESTRVAAAVTALDEGLRSVSFVSLAITVWLSGSLILLLLIARRTWRFARHLRHCPPANAAEHEAVDALARRIGLSRAPDVRISAATHPPLVWCLGLRPVLVLPRSLMQQLSRDEQTTVLAHELAHIARGDHLVRLLEAAVITLFWWHPVVWWARRELQRYEEQCCDTDVLQICPDSPETYVNVLMKTVEFLQTRRPVAVAFTSAMAQKHSLVERIERILGDGRPARWSWASRLTALVLVALLPLSVGWGAGDEQKQTENPNRQTANEADDATPSPENPPEAAAASDDSSDSPAEATPAVPTGLADARPTVQFKFEGPQGLKVHRGHYGNENDDEAYTAPFRIDLAGGAAHPLTLSDVPEHAGLTLYPTLEVAECKPQHQHFLQHNSVPIELTAEDLDQVASGNFVTKIIYFPDRDDQEVDRARFDVLVSTRLDPDLDPVAEADRRGTIVAVLRLGNRSKPPAAKQQELVPFDRPYGELGFTDGQYGPHYETVRLATHAPVQNELDLSASQRRRLAPVSTSLMQKSDRWPRSGDHPDLLKEEYDRTLSILTAAQKQRLDEIIFRRLGYAAFLQPQFAEQIGLTPQQSEQFRQAWKAHLKRAADGWDGDEGRQAYHKLQAETFAALTPEQRQRYAERIGDPLIATPEVADTPPPKTAPPERTTLMPEFVNEVLYWLPTDTETLIISRDFQARTIRDDASWKKSLAEPDYFRLLTRSLAAAPLFDLPPAVQELFTGEQIEWAILGGRNYEFTSAFGSYRFDGCTVLRFAEPILKTGDTDYDSYESPGEPHPVVAAIQKAAKEQWLISQSQVYVFPVNTKLRESWVKPRTGEGLYLALHDDHTMILATSDVYMLQTLRRIEGESLDRTMPATLPEWKELDFSAGTLGIRRVPERTASGEPTTVSSVTWRTIRDDQPNETIAVMYRPRGKADLQATLRQHWFRAEGPETEAILGVRQHDNYCMVTLNRTANAAQLLPALLFPIQGLPATSF